MKLIYSDRNLVVCVKPAGVLSTDEPGGLPQLVRQALDEVDPSVYTVHRLDRVVSGLMVLARTRRSARELSAQIQAHTFGKEYLAVVHGVPELDAGTFTDLLLRDPVTRRTAVTQMPQKGAQEAELDYQVLGQAEGLSLVRIRLKTGRTHQIRVQFSSRGLPLVGDQRYGMGGDDCDIALFSCHLDFLHPKTGERLVFDALPSKKYPWDRLL